MFLSQLTGNEHLNFLHLLAGVLFAGLFCLGLLVCRAWLFWGAGGKGRGDGSEGVFLA